MGVRDALLLNQTGSNFEALQSNDTARVKGDLSLQKDDGTEVLGIDVSAATLNLTGGITGSGNISSSLSSTGSFGRVVATTFHGDGSSIRDTLPRSVGIVTQSAQLAAQISGAFTSGFEMSASISGSATSTGSFGRLEGEFFFGDGSGIKTTLPRSTGILTSSAQIASNISGSFNKGFQFSGTIQTKASGWDSWATHQPLNTGRAALGGKGNRSAAIAVAGVTNYAAPHSEAGQMGHYYFSGEGVNCTEEWDGTSWTEVNDTLDAGSTGYGGTTEAGYAMGRRHPLTAQTEEWNGTNWSEGPTVTGTPALPNHRDADAGGCAPNTMYIIGGYGSQGSSYFTTFDGSTFSEENDMPSVYHFGRNGHSGNASSALAWGSSCRKSNGDCTNQWDGTSWTEVAALPKIIDRGTGAGTVNDSYAYGGRCATEGGPTYGQHHCDTFLTWDGSTWSERTDIPTPAHTEVYGPATGHNEAIGVGAGSSDVFVFGGKEYMHSGNDYMAVSASLMFNSFITSASFGRLEFTKISGDGSGLTSTLPYSPGILSSSAQIASQISGSFNKGFEFSGEISGSATSTGSFGRVVANKFFGDATNIQASLPYPGVVTGSAQIASRVSGSFNKGFEYSGKIAAAPSAWLLGPDMVNGRHRMGGKGTFNAAIAVAGGITNAPDHSEAGYVSHPSYYRRVCNTEEFNGTTWSEVNDLNFGGPRGYGGTTEDGAAIGAEHPESNNTEHWNGTNWSEGPAIDTGCNHRDGRGGGCVPTKLYAIGGFDGGGGHPHVSSYNKDAGTFAAEASVPSNWTPGAAHTGNADDLLIWGHTATSPTQLYNGTSWSQLANSLFPNHSDSTGQEQLPGGGGRIFPHPYAHVPSAGAGVASAQSGTSNDAYSYGGYGAYGAGVNSQYGNITTAKHYNWDGSSWSYQGVIPVRGTGWTPGTKPPSPDLHGDVGPVVNYPAGMGHHNATGVGAGSADAFVFGGYYAMSPSAYPNHPFQYDYELASGSYHYPEKSATLSAGLLTFLTGSGDATSLQGKLYPGVLSGSAQIASRISGSFNKGFGFEGQISGSATSTGSFGRLVADNFFGSAKGIQSSLPYPSGILSSSAQIADRVSGSFISGFTHGGEISGVRVTAGGVWVTGGDLNVPRHSGAMAGTQNAAFYIAGNLSSGHGWYGGGNQTCTEEYNGTNWSVGTAFPLDSEGTNLFPLAPAGPDPGGKAGTGTQNAALVFGGRSHYQTPQSTGSAFEYDGTAFTQVAFMPENMERHIGAGTQNATISYGGYKRSMSSPYPTQTNDYAHTWNGSVWSNITKMNNARSGHASTPNGTVNSTMAMGATANAPDIKSTECWNGSSWSEIAEQNIARYNTGGAGSPDDAQVFGGQGGYGSSTPTTGGTSEYWNGTTWVTGANLNRAQASPGGDGSNIRGAGTAAAALAAGGYPGAGAFTGTEEYVGASSAKLEYPVIHAKTFSGDATQFTASLFQGMISGSAQVASHISGAFSDGIGPAVLNTGDNRQGSAGGVKHSFQAGGVGTGTWKMSKPAIIPRGMSRLAGTQNSALLMGGDCVTANGGCCVEAWDGTAWEERQGLAAHNNQGYKSGGGYGTQNAAMVTAGRPNAVTDTLQYNGSVWTEVNNFNYTRGRYAHSGCSQNDAIMTGGLGADNASQCSCTEIWDGTTWTEKDSPIRGIGHGHVGGGSSNAFVMGGSQVSPAGSTQTEEWNGVSWTSHANNLYDYVKRGQQGDGSIYNFMHFGGTNSTYPRLDSVEFFDGVGWKIGPHLLVSVGGSFNDGSGRGFGGGMGEGGGLTVGGDSADVQYCINAQMFDQEATSTGSFGSLKGFGESTLKTNALFVSGSTFKLPLMSDKDINYQDYQPQEATGSTSGSFERKPDKNIFTRPGNFFFHSDYNALGYTYQSSSVYSQSVDFVTCYYSSASAANLVSTASTGFITQSHYCYTTVVCYITGSYV